MNNTEAQWVQAEQFGLVIRGLRSTQLAAVFAVLTLCALCWSAAPLAWVGVWGAVWAALAVQRFFMCRHYEQVIRTQPVPQQLAYARRCRWVWFTYALSWGAAALVFAGRLSEATEIACWLVVAGVGAVTMSRLSAHLPTVKGFLLTLIASVTVCVAAAAVLTGDRLAEGAARFIMPTAVLLLWIVLLGAVDYLHRLATRSIDLGYRNERLIESLREQTRAAQEALRFRDRYLASAAHDLKQPVNALGIYAQWLRNEPELAHELAERILQSTRAIDALFDALFDMMKLDAGRLNMKIEPVDLGELLEGIEVQFRPLAVQKGLNLRIRPLNATVHSDAMMLRRILANLVSNAIRYTRQGGILVAARRRGDAVSLEVWDTGIGIPPDEHENVFGEFYKVPMDGSEGEFGLGLGLPIVRRLADRLSYPVTMRSRLGRGTTFKVLTGPAPRPPVRSSAAR